MKLFLAIVIACACCPAVRAERFSFDSHVGVVDANEGRLCLNIPDARLADGTEVSIILPDRPQRVVKAAVEGKAAQNCSRNAGAESETSSYLLKLAGSGRAIDLSQPMPPAIAVVSPARPVSVRRGVASVDLDGDGRAEFFRACTSSEGNHLTVWSGRPLVGKRVWHSYYYLGYDVVPNCKRKDYQ